MTNPVKLEFVALDIFGYNYLSWFLHVILNLSANSLKDTIDLENNPRCLTKCQTNYLSKTSHP